MIIQEIDKRIIELGKVTKNKKVLDLGCGTNKYKKYFMQKNKFIGIDVKTSGRETNQKTPDVFYDGKKLPFNDGNFDLIICTEVLEHVENFELVVSEIFRSLKRNGSAVITMPFITAEHEIPYDFRRFTSYGIKKEFENMGFMVKKFEKILFGHAVIRQLLYGEMKRYEETGKVNFFTKFFLRSIFRFAFRILGIFYKLDRVYFDNYIEIEKK
jgi:ubiquinone/menaquinone biosynthesis C-methylase UbiE